MVKVKNLKFAYKNNSNPVFKDLTIEFASGFNVILGPNGAGKTTLVKSIFGLLDYQGQILYGDKNITSMSLSEKIKLMSYLPQMDINMSSLSVLEMVLLGRLPDLSRKISDEDLDIVMETLESLSIVDLAPRNFSDLSGGQKKLVFIAQTLVRKPRLIILDEPTNSLDLQKQLELCQLLKRIVLDKGVDLIVILHDINLAARYGDHIVLINDDGSHYVSGPPKDVITSRMLLDVYGVIGDVSLDSNQIPLVFPKASVRFL